MRTGKLTWSDKWDMLIGEYAEDDPSDDEHDELGNRRAAVVHRVATSHRERHAL